MKFDRDIFILIVVVALAISLNTGGLLQFIQGHVGVTTLRTIGYAAAFTGGGWVGLFSRRIASRITDWRDRA